MALWARAGIQHGNGMATTCKALGKAYALCIVTGYKQSAHMAFLGTVPYCTFVLATEVDHSTIPAFPACPLVDQLIMMAAFQRQPSNASCTWLPASIWEHLTQAHV
jgi:hypothetical protein